jgi:hypothetical protein
MIGAPEGSCLDEGIATLVCGIINCVADLATTITPLPLIMGLHMPFRQRVAVGLLFSMGTIVTVAGIVRTWYIYKSLISESDNTWYAFPLWIAAAVEIDLGVVSLPNHQHNSNNDSPRFVHQPQCSDLLFQKSPLVYPDPFPRVSRFLKETIAPPRRHPSLP